MKKQDKNIIEGLFREANDDARLANTLPLEETVETDVNDLFTVVGASAEKSERLESAPYSYWRIVFSKLLKNPLVIICLAVLGLIVFFTIFGTTINYYDPFMYDANGNILKNTNNMFGDLLNSYVLGPNPTNWFGVCASNMGGWFQGLDMWSVIWKGSQLSLLIGVTVAVINTIVGILIGSLWGYFRWLDPILIEFRNFINNIPTILLNIMIMQALKQYMADFGFFIIVGLLSMFGWIGLAGFIRNQIIIIRNREYNIASQTLGSSSTAMITHNLLPYLISVIVTVVSTAIPQAISAEVGLAFFGLSFQISDGDITLGQVLTQAVKDQTWMSAPYLIIAPMVVMAPLTITFFYLGMALADATDPKTHR